MRTESPLLNRHEMEYMGPLAFGTGGGLLSSAIAKGLGADIPTTVGVGLLGSALGTYYGRDK